MHTDFTHIISEATEKFLEEQSLDTAAEINNGYCHLFIQHLQETYDLPDDIEVVDACGVHSWIYYDGQHYDAENQSGVENANNLYIWGRTSNQTIENVALRCKYISIPQPSTGE